MVSTRYLVWTPLVIVEIAIFTQSRKNVEGLMLFIKPPFTPKKIDQTTIFILGFLQRNGNKDHITRNTIFPTQDLSTKLLPPKKFWELREKDLSPQIDWEFIGFSQTPSSFKDRCNLCLEEKIRIIKFSNQNILLKGMN